MFGITAFERIGEGNMTRMSEWFFEKKKILY